MYPVLRTLADCVRIEPDVLDLLEALYFPIPCHLRVIGVVDGCGACGFVLCAPGIICMCALVSGGGFADMTAFTAVEAGHASFSACYFSTDGFIFAACDALPGLAVLGHR